MPVCDLWNGWSISDRAFRWRGPAGFISDPGRRGTGRGAVGARLPLVTALLILGIGAVALTSLVEPLAEARRGFAVPGASVGLAAC
jgi:hypothetical protein